MIAVTSGKGGAGKTTLSLNLAMALASKGLRTCLFDADLGLANVNVMLGLSAPQTLEDAIFGKASLEDVVLRNIHGFDIIPGASGVQKMADLPPEPVTRLLRSFSLLDAYDVVLMDTSAGVAKSVIAFCLSAPEVILVVNPEPASMTDAYALLKILTMNAFPGKVRVVVSRCKNVSEAKAFFTEFQKTVLHYLDLRPVLLGVVVQDRKVQEAVRKREPVLLRHPGSNASRCIQHMAGSLMERGPAAPVLRGEPSFWERWLQRLRGPLEGVAPEADQEDRATASKSMASASPPDAVMPPESPDTEDTPQDREDEAPASLEAKKFLAQHVQALTREVRGVRIALEAMATPRPQSPAAPYCEPSAFSNGETELLDFDAFVERHRSKRKGNPA